MLLREGAGEGAEASMGAAEEGKYAVARYSAPLLLVLRTPSTGGDSDESITDGERLLPSASAAVRASPAVSTALPDGIK